MAAERKSTVEEEDLDDLDDIVDQFDPNPPKPNTTPKPALPTSQPSTEPSMSSTIPETSTKAPDASSEPDATPQQESDELPEDLAKQLAESMESFMRELAGTQAAPVNEEETKLREEWEKMLIEGMNGVNIEDGATPEDSTASKEPSSSGSEVKTTIAEDEFQKSIRAAMEKLKSSDSALHSDASASAASTDPLEEILNSLGSGFDGMGEDTEELQGMLETMMKQLMSKDVLYEPLKELHDKFPGYIEEHKATLSIEDKTRYQNQFEKVTQVIAIFEDSSYSDEDTEKSAQVVNLMNEMQSFGSPPAEIMGPMPPGLNFGSDGAPKLPDDCIIS